MVISGKNDFSPRACEGTDQLLTMKGLIALDIDGTITADNHSISLEVVNYLTSLTDEGWIIILITGRTFHMTFPIISTLSFPITIALQNGALILEMPSRKILKKKYLNKDILSSLPTDSVIYSGYENGDRCYYRSKHFDSELMDYLQKRIVAFQEDWTDVYSFEDIDIQEFPSIKYFGHHDSAQRIATQLEQQLHLHAPCIRDPFNGNYYVVQATDPTVDKGQALLDYKTHIGCNGTVIAAGNDNNDLTMLAQADIKIVMATASQKIRDVADIIAPPAEENGIIQGITEALI